MKLPVKNLANESVGEIELDDAIFGVAVREDLIFRAVNWQLAKRRSGNHKTKGISEISGTTKKPYNQKGTGRARQGSSRSPLWKKGGITFGPKPREFGYSVSGLRIAVVCFGFAISGVLGYWSLCLGF